MGYTHYWSFNGKRGQTAQNEKKYQNALKQCVKVVQYYSKTFGGLSGYTAHDVSKRYGGLNVNGSERVGSCETFAFREHMSQNEPDACKTNRCQYDTVVTACLIIMKQYLGDSFQVGSDGFVSDWADGLILAEKVTRLKLSIPVSIETKRKVA
jgi:hypothetical protein